MLPRGRSWSLPAIYPGSSECSLGRGWDTGASGNELLVPADKSPAWFNYLMQPRAGEAVA